MTKVALNDLVNLENQTSVVNTINANNAVIETAFDNTLSRDGLSPNQMQATLDMNSNPIINLPAPISDFEPMRLIDATTLSGGGVISVSSLPVGGTSGQHLEKNSNTNFDVSWKDASGSGSSYLAPYTGAVIRTVGSKLNDLISVLDFGVSNTGVNCTTTLQAAITASSVIIPPGTYNLNGDIQIPSNRFIWVQKGANITNTGGRFTAFVPGGGDIRLVIDGTISFISTNTAPVLGDWGSFTTANRGLIEMGGTVATPAYNLVIEGTGRVSSDFVWPGTPPSAYVNQPYQNNRKGISLFNANLCVVEGLDVSNIWGEAIYHQSFGGEYVQFIRNIVHEVAFNGLNFNTTGVGHRFSMVDNYVKNCWQGIEASAGHISNNTVFLATNGIITGAGNGGAPLTINNNVFKDVINGIQVSFATTIEDVMINGNQIHNANGIGILVDNISTFQLKDNNIYIYATTTAGYGIIINAGASIGFVDGNLLRGAGAFSLGNVVNNGAFMTIGTNPVF